MKFRKSSQKVISHHFLLPAIAIFLVAIVGGVIATQSSSAATITTGRADSSKIGKQCYRKPHSIWRKTGSDKMSCVCVNGYVVNPNKNCVKRGSSCGNNKVWTSSGKCLKVSGKRGSSCGNKKVWATNGRCVNIGEICKRPYANPNSKDPYDWYTWSSKGTCTVGHWR